MGHDDEEWRRRRRRGGGKEDTSGYERLRAVIRTSTLSDLRPRRHFERPAALWPREPLQTLQTRDA